MLEFKIVVEAKDLSEAITQLAQAMSCKCEAISAEQRVTVPFVEPVAEKATNAPEPVAEKATPDTVPTPQPVSEPIQAPIPEPMPEPIPEPTPTIDLDTISRAGAALVDQGKMNEVLGILQKKYGIYAVTQLRQDQYNAFADDLRALGANI